MKTVLIVDDSLYMRTMISDVLTEAAGFKIIGLAPNGETAIDLALELNPDLITLDNILADMIGTDILETLKKEKEFTSKVIMISAVGNDSVVKEAMKLGATSYLVKPFTSEALINEINKIFT